MTFHIAVLVSGRGSNLEAILKNIQAGRLSAKMSCVISDNPKAKALKIAEAHHVPTHIIESQNLDRENFDRLLIAKLQECPIDLIVLAGFMRLLTPTFLAAYPNKVINIHPALLPAFKGLHAQRQTIEYGAKVAGCTVHFVDAGCDSGPIIAQLTVPVLQNDTEASLSERILTTEHQLYSEIIEKFAQGKVHLHGRKVKVEY